MTATMTDHPGLDTPGSSVGVVAPSAETDQPTPGAQVTSAGSAPSTTPPALHSTAPTAASVEWAAFDELRVYAECLADAMDHRIALTNRLRSGTVPADVTAELKADLDHTEKLLRKGMVKSFRRAAPAVAAWTRETVGLGEETMARLLGTIGHPVVARPHHWEGEGAARTLVADEPYLRTVSQLWSYCGHGDPARRRRKGMTADDAMALGSPHAKKLTYLLAVACMKCNGTPAANVPPTPTLVPPLGEIETDDAIRVSDPVVFARRRSPYRDVYDDRRLVTLGRDDWTDGHKNADALRLTGKAILRDLWIVARTDTDAAS